MEQGIGNGRGSGNWVSTVSLRGCPEGATWQSGLFSRSGCDLSPPFPNDKGIGEPEWPGTQSLPQAAMLPVQGKVTREAGRKRSVPLRYRWFACSLSEERPLPSFPEQCKHFPGNPPSPEPLPVVAGEGFVSRRPLFQLPVPYCLGSSPTNQNLQA